MYATGVYSSIAATLTIQRTWNLEIYFDVVLRSDPYLTVVLVRPGKRQDESQRGGNCISNADNMTAIYNGFGNAALMAATGAATATAAAAGAAAAVAVAAAGAAADRGEESTSAAATSSQPLLQTCNREQHLVSLKSIIYNNFYIVYRRVNTHVAGRNMCLNNILKIILRTPSKDQQVINMVC